MLLEVQCLVGVGSNCCYKNTLEIYKSSNSRILQLGMHTANKILSDKRSNGSLYTANKILSDKRGDGSLYTSNNMLSDKRDDGLLYTASKILSDKRGDGSL